jgi:hypothetical protein
VSQSMPSARAPSLTTAIFCFVALGAALAIASGSYLVADRGASVRQDALAEAVTVRARGLQLDFARALHQEWRNARTIAGDIAKRDPSAIRSSLDLVVGDSSRVSWAGIAALDGTVKSASGGLLEGQNVSQRPWFQRGLEGNFAGDVHDAVLLAKLLPQRDGEPRRFLDLATPIRDERGTITGVLGLHLDEAWAVDHLRQSAQSLQIDVVLVNREGSVVMATDPAIGPTLNLSSARAAMTGAAMATVETWPDGVDYLTTVIPSVEYKDLPSFGWSLIARIDDDAYIDRTSLAPLLTIPILFGLALLVLTFAFVQIFARPFGRLAESAAAVLKGEDIYPYESRSTDEILTLSAAVARLQGKAPFATGQDENDSRRAKSLTSAV